MIFRSAHPGDIDNILSIEDDCFPEGIKESRKLYWDRISIFPTGCVVCEIENRCIGCIFAEIWQVDSYHEDLFMSEDSINERHAVHGNTFYISSFGILKSYRGKKIAHNLYKKLTENLTTAYPSIKNQLLVVGEPWTPARSTYERHGFKVVDNVVLKSYFEPEGSESFNAIVMDKKS